MTPVLSIVEVCSALGDDTRWAILRHLGREPASASSLATHLPISRQAVTQHLDVLLAAGLVERHRHGREVRYRPLGSTVSAAARQMETLASGWDRRLEDLQRKAEAAGPSVKGTPAE